MGHPCSVNPEMWFGYADDDGGDGAAKARAYEQSATEARLQCLRRCPLAQQRLCAKYAVENREEYGVWAGVKLPGGVNPISRCGPEEMPTMPHPTSAMGWPASTCAPTGTSAGEACP